MIKIFITLLNMSIIASYVAFFVIIVRLLLKKTPKVFSYGLWAIVFFRMICPFSFENIFSILPKNTNTIPQDIIYSQNPAINSRSALLNGVVNKTIEGSLPPVKVENSVNSMGLILEFSASIWCLGIIILLTYSIVSYFKLKSRLSTATLVEQNVFETDAITSPFVMGFIKPKIYLPVGLLDADKGYILLHERVHIKRLDYLVKPLALLATAIHWFNPLMWLSYKLMSKDMEMCCDEKVLKTMGEDIKIDYSRTLLSFSEKQSGLLSPLGFGENNAKSRINNVINYKRPTFWVLLLVVVTVTAISIGLLSNPKIRKEETITNSKTQAELTSKKTTALKSEMFSDITKIEIKYSVFNDFESGYHPYVIEDKTLINTITQMMGSAVIVTDEEVTEVDRANNPHSTITLYEKDVKTEIPYIIDDLYSKSIF
jgi:beta-lactamase regulating signal transducer with metallopeptidase domain